MPDLIQLSRSFRKCIALGEVARTTDVGEVGWIMNVEERLLVCTQLESIPELSPVSSPWHKMINLSLTRRHSP